MHGGFKTQVIREAVVQHGRIVPDTAPTEEPAPAEDIDAIALDAQYRHLVRSYIRGILTLDQYLVRVERLLVAS